MIISSLIDLIHNYYFIELDSSSIGNLIPFLVAKRYVLEFEGDVGVDGVVDTDVLLDSALSVLSKITILFEV